MAEPARCRQLQLIEPGRFPQRPQPLPGTLPVRPPGRHHLAEVGGGLGGGEVGRVDVAPATDPHRGEFALGNPAADGVARDAGPLGGLGDGESSGRVAAVAIPIHRLVAPGSLAARGAAHEVPLSGGDSCR